jgi:hypothetical protein
MMMPASPAAIALSIASIGVVVSSSLDPAEMVSLTPSLAARVLALSLFSVPSRSWRQMP